MSKKERNLIILLTFGTIDILVAILFVFITVDSFKLFSDINFYILFEHISKPSIVIYVFMIIFQLKIYFKLIDESK